MAINVFEENGKYTWQVYVNIRSKVNQRIRKQGRASGEAETEEKAKVDALKAERKLIQLKTEEVKNFESKGITWEEVLEKYEMYFKKYPKKNCGFSTLRDTMSRLRNWTSSWNKISACEINRGDVRAVFAKLEEKEKRIKYRKYLKTNINEVFVWGIEERLILGILDSPAKNHEISGSDSEARPLIMNKPQLKDLISKAYKVEHDWRDIWYFVSQTGLRSQEANGFRESDLDLVSIEEAREIENKILSAPKGERARLNLSFGKITIQRQWRPRTKDFGSLKAGYWRSVPVNRSLYWWLIEQIKTADFGSDEYGRRLLPRFSKWDRGEQASELRNFCELYGFESIVFHTLRACFATQLLASGAKAPIVMKICGWKDWKTMMRYIRLAGVDESGATEDLDFPNPLEMTQKPKVDLSNVIDLFERK